MSEIRNHRNHSSFRRITILIAMTNKFGELLGIRLASQSMGYLSVLGPALSEPMKINLLKGNWNASATATLADTGIYWFTSAIFGLASAMSKNSPSTSCPTSIRNSLAGAVAKRTFARAPILRKCRSIM